MLTEREKLQLLSEALSSYGCCKEKLNFKRSLFKEKLDRLNEVIERESIEVERVGLESINATTEYIGLLELEVESLTALLVDCATGVSIENAVIMRNLILGGMNNGSKDKLDD